MGLYYLLMFDNSFNVLHQVFELDTYKWLKLVLSNFEVLKRFIGFEFNHFQYKRTIGSKSIKNIYLPIGFGARSKKVDYQFLDLMAFILIRPIGLGSKPIMGFMTRISKFSI